MRHKAEEVRKLLAECILHLRSRRASSRTSLARSMQLSRSTVGIYVDQLIRGGLVRESGQEMGYVGRPRRALRLCSEAGWFAGIEHQAGRVRAIAVDFAGGILARHSEPLPDDADQSTLLEYIRKVFCVLDEKISTPLLAVGIAAPSRLGEDVFPNGRTANEWRAMLLGHALHGLTRAPVYVEHRLHAMVLAERCYGLQHSLKDYVIMSSHQSFSVAMVNDGKVATGARHVAGEVGAWPCQTNAGRGLGDMLSAPAIYRRLTGLDEAHPLPKDLTGAYAGLRGKSVQCVEEVASDFARIIGCLQLLLDPEVFMIHGPVCALGDAFCYEIKRQVSLQVPGLGRCPLRVECSGLGEEAGVLGAACFAAEKWQELGTIGSLRTYHHRRENASALLIA